MGLIDRKQSAEDLFGGNPSILLRWDNVYYRKKSRHKMIQAPARILWYVSGRIGAIVAVSYLDEVEVGLPNLKNSVQYVPKTIQNWISNTTMNKTAPPLLISLKPDYADLVFRGLKTAELRRRLSKHIENRDVFVYVTSPVKELRGGFRVGQVCSGSPEQIWTTVSRLAGVSRETFDDYYHGSNVAFAIEIIDVWEYANPCSLEDLRKRFSNFVVPQSYRYAKANESRSFQNMKRIRKEKPFSQVA